MNIHEESVTQTSYVGSISRALITFTMCWGGLLLFASSNCIFE